MGDRVVELKCALCSNIISVPLGNMVDEDRLTCFCGSVLDTSDIKKILANCGQNPGEVFEDKTIEALKAAGYKITGT